MNDSYIFLVYLSIAEIAWHVINFLITKKYFSTKDELIFFGFVCFYSCYSVIAQLLLLPEFSLNLGFSQQYMYLHFAIIGISKTYATSYYFYNYVSLPLTFLSAAVLSIGAINNSYLSPEYLRVNTGASVIMQQLFGKNYAGNLPFKRTAEEEKIINFLQSATVRSEASFLFCTKEE